MPSTSNRLKTADLIGTPPWWKYLVKLRHTCITYSADPAMEFGAKLNLFAINLLNSCKKTIGQFVQLTCNGMIYYLNIYLFILHPPGSRDFHQVGGPPCKGPTEPTFLDARSTITVDLHIMSSSGHLSADMVMMMIHLTTIITITSWDNPHKAIRS